MHSFLFAINNSLA